MITSDMQNQLAVEAILGSALFAGMLTLHPELAKLFTLDTAFGAPIVLVQLAILGGVTALPLLSPLAHLKRLSWLNATMAIITFAGAAFHAGAGTARLGALAFAGLCGVEVYRLSHSVRGTEPLVARSVVRPTMKRRGTKIGKPEVPPVRKWRGPGALQLGRPLQRRANLKRAA